MEGANSNGPTAQATKETTSTTRNMDKAGSCSLRGTTMKATGKMDSSMGRESCSIINPMSWRKGSGKMANYLVIYDNENR